MKLARISYWDNNPWRLGDGAKINPPVGTIVQYKRVVSGGYDVYFPGVHGCASMPGSMFSTYFKDLDDETS